MKKLLMIAYYFPPLGMGGTQRPAKFAKYLPHFGWQPTVVTVKPISYWAQDVTLLDELSHIRIVRTESLDPQRLIKRLSRNRSPGGIRTSTSSSGNKILQFVNRTVLPFFLMPDSKILWKSCAFRVIGSLCRNERFDAIYTTSPPHSVHLLGRQVAAAFDIKWVADFRDSWAGGVVVNEPTVIQRALNRRLQKSVIDSADAVLSVTRGIMRQLETSGSGHTEITLLPNGYDPGDFRSIPRQTDRRTFVFCHCGSITVFSNPVFFLKAIAEFIKSYNDLAQKCLFRFVGHDSLGVFADMVKEEGVEKSVDIAEYRSHSRALEDMVNADALVLIARGRQGETFIPGKTFEYIGSGKPILAMTDVEDTADLLNGIPGAVVIKPDDIPRIVAEIAHLVQNPPEDRKLDGAMEEGFSRKYQTGLLADVLDRMCGFADRSSNRVSSK